MKQAFFILFYAIWVQQSFAQSILVEPNEFKQLSSDTSIQKLDVRTKAEFAIVGHIPNFEQISITDKNFDEKVLQEFNINQPIMVTCFSGHRSVDAVVRLQKLGFKRIVELKGGLINWMEKGYGLE